ncbi:hypothetical protein BDGGKGIB_00699 [Nodularia sphaerocarpa UHCC 0038]|nr:hypothetical protein BDGGKGIB_00699 [Nodularia sphaerocarpa UHCC 0038]
MREWDLMEPAVLISQTILDFGFWILDFGLIPQINLGACTIKKLLKPDRYQILYTYISLFIVMQ